MKNKKWIIAIIVIIVILLIGYRVYQKNAHGNSKAAKMVNAANVKVAKVTQGLVGDEFTGSGNIIMNNAVTYTAQSAGTLESINVVNGQSVNKGQVLFTIRSTSVASSYSSAVSQVSSMKEALANAKFTYDRYQKLFKQQLVAESDYLIQQNVYVAAENNYNAAVAALSNAQYNNSQLVVRSDLNGYVSGITVTTSQNQLTQGQVLCTVSSESQPTVIVGVTADDMYKLTQNKNSQVSVSIPSINKKFIGKIMSINPAADVNSQLYDVKVSINSNGTELLPGMYAEVDMMIGQNQSLIVPENSVVLGSFGSYIFVIREGKALEVMVNMGTTFGDNMGISATGLQAGDLVVTEGQFTLNDGESVKILNEKDVSGASTISGSGVTSGNSTMMPPPGHKPKGA
ncbi:MAG: efflux RND transporter periplasmic adaptor subunit [Fusobacteria bacterium]|nr:efflux RND transporter periplasmic adaptor subunit [Fusobacteriota bacterium]